MLIQALSTSCRLSSNSAYHRIENPPHTVTRRDALKLKMTTSAIGT
jgi:hypothetical protein